MIRILESLEGTKEYKYKGFTIHEEYSNIPGLPDINNDWIEKNGKRYSIPDIYTGPGAAKLFIDDIISNEFYGNLNHYRI